MCPFLFYYVIEGLSGVLSYLGIYRNQRKYYNVIIRGLEILVNLTKDIEIQGQVVPGWYIPVQNQFSELESKIFIQKVISIPVYLMVLQDH